MRGREVGSERGEVGVSPAKPGLNLTVTSVSAPLVCGEVRY